MKSSERIQRYLDGEMSEEELWSFQEDIKKHPELKEELDLHLLIEKSLKGKKERRFREKLEKSYHNAQLNTVNSSFNKNNSVKIAYLLIPLAAILIAGIFIFIPGFRPDKDSLFEEYYTPINISYGSRSAEASAEETRLMSGIEAYLMGDLELSKRMITSYLSNEPEEKAAANYFLGLTYMELHDYPNAEICFKNIVNDSINYYQEHSRWYLALVLLKEDRIEEARQLFDQISMDGSVHSEKSKEILKKITRIK